MNISSAIRQFILEHPDQIIDGNYLHRTLFPIVEYRTFLKIMSRLVNEGTIRTINRGVYAPSTLPDEKIGKAIVSYYTNDAAGMIVGDALYYELDLIDKCPTRTEIYTNRVDSIKKKSVLNYELYGKDLIFDDDTKNLITLFELIENNSRTISYDATQYATIVNGICSRSYSENLIKEITSVMKYRGSTIVAAKKLLNGEKFPFAQI